MKSSQFLLRLVFSIIFLFLSVQCVDRSNFKTCSQAGFCTYQRSFKPEITQYYVDEHSIKKEDTEFSCTIRHHGNSDELQMSINFYDSHVFRIKIQELSEVSHRYVIPEGDVVLDNILPMKLTYLNSDPGILIFGTDKDKISLEYKQFKIEIYKNDILIIVLNGDKLFNFQTHNAAQIAKSASNETDLNWKETFKGHIDSKIHGPSSLGLDVTFLNFENVYGIPEHADSFLLRDTSSLDPYRLYNLDVFAYELRETMALYGSVPVIFAHSSNNSVGIFWNNPSETWIDITSSKTANSGIFSSFFPYNEKWTRTHWMSETGILDLFILPGKKPEDVSRQYASITGTTALPPLFSLAYHQCRWNYKDQADIMDLETNFDKYKIPVDVLWLDIEHTDGKRYFTWDKEKFPSSDQMVDKLLEKKRKMVTVVDPHIKSDSNWNLYNEGKSLDLYIKDASGAEYSGWCWPGSSAYPDFTSSKTRDWWARQFLSYHPVRTDTMFSWNDMGEPSVFSGPEVSMQKDALHLNGFEHRDVHNLYGMYIHQATWAGQLHRSGNKKRPFVLTRAFFAGSQRTSAVWTGDNAAEWSHLKITVPMLLSLSITGVTFCGADVGGFFNNPEEELLIRWYQAGAFQPFFRAHAHLDTPRREPWLYPEEVTNRIRSSIEQRYALLPYWYTTFALAEHSGQPPMNPLWYYFPNQIDLFEWETSYMIGEAVLVSPVLEKGVSQVNVRLPAGSNWYQYPQFKLFKGGQTVSIPVTMDDIPVFYRSGYIIPKRERMRRSSSMMSNDPYTLYVLVSPNSNEANGYIYEDDNETIKDPQRLLLKISFKILGQIAELKLEEPSPNLLANHPNPREGRPNKFERIVFVGLKNFVKTCQVIKNELKYPVDCEYQPRDKDEASVLVVRKPNIQLNTNWKLLLEPLPRNQANL